MDFSVDQHSPLAVFPEGTCVHVDSTLTVIGTDGVHISDEQAVLKAVQDISVKQTRVRLFRSHKRSPTVSGAAMTPGGNAPVVGSTRLNKAGVSAAQDNNTPEIKSTNEKHR